MSGTIPTREGLFPKVLAKDLGEEKADSPRPMTKRSSSSPLVTDREFLLRAQGIRKDFVKSGAKIEVLKGVDLDLLPGERLAITGPSGAGKSTLLHVLGTLEPPTKGRLYYESQEQEVSRWKDAELARFRNEVMGFVFQFHYLLPEFDAVENVMMPALIGGHSPAAAKKQAKELLDFVGLSSRLTHRPSELSGGEQQRVAIARSVILRPKILFADEVTGNLDSENSQKVVELLEGLNQETGVTIVMVTHDLGLAKRMKRLVQMRDGCLV